MPDEETKSLEEWMAEERARLDEGFDFEPQPATMPTSSPVAEDVLAGLGIGAGVAGGAVAPHPNPITFEGVKASVVANALKSELTGDDTHVQIDHVRDSILVTFLQSQEDQPYDFFPVLTATLLESADTLTVTLSKLDQNAVRDALTSMGGTVVSQGKRLLLGRRGIAGLLDAAGNLIEGVGELVENVQDLGLPKQVWEVIDRVGEAAEETYFEQEHREAEAQRRKEDAEHAWTHCPSCGRAYRPEEAERVDCPSCGAPRGAKPDWLE